MYVNGLGHQIFLDCIKDNLDIKKIKEYLLKDMTELPAGYPRLWFAVYGNVLKIMNLRSEVLNEYEMV